MVVTTQARGLKARVWWNRKRRMYEWSLRNDTGDLLAAGEEFRIAPAFENAHDSVLAVQLWTMFGRGAISNPKGDLSFLFTSKYSNTTQNLSGNL